MSEEKLLPCPFCGKKIAVVMSGTEIEDIGEFDLPDEMAHAYDESFAVLCNFSLGGCGSVSGYRKNEEEAADIWNTRDLKAMVAAAGEGE